MSLGKITDELEKRGETPTVERLVSRRLEELIAEKDPQPETRSDRYNLSFQAGPELLNLLNRLAEDLETSRSELMRELLTSAGLEAEERLRELFVNHSKEGKA